MTRAIPRLEICRGDLTRLEVGVIVNAAVADHSRYRTDPLRRGVRTFTAVYAMVFGTREEASAAALAVHRVHQRVRGVMRDPLPAGMSPRYRADDPELL